MTWIILFNIKWMSVNHLGRNWNQILVLTKNCNIVCTQWSAYICTYVDWINLQTAIRVRARNEEKNSICFSNFSTLVVQQCQGEAIVAIVN